PARQAAAVDRRRRAPSRARRVHDPRHRRPVAPDRGDRDPAHRGGRSCRGRCRVLLGGALVKVRLWGTRGSVASPGADTARYGGNTSCVEVCGGGDVMAVLDAGTGIRPLGTLLAPHVRTVHILLSHLHMDHIQGLGFFKPLFDPEVETHLWGPAIGHDDLRRRLVRYLSPPLFPVHLRDLPRCKLHDLPTEPFQVGDLRVTAERVCHPGHTVGFRIEQNGNSMAYLSDHEPALGAAHFPLAAEWTSGYAIAK